MPTPTNNGLNPFAPPNAQLAATQAMLVSRITASEPSPFWQGRAAGLAASIAPLLAWIGQAKSIDLSGREVTTLLQFDTLVAFGDRRPVVPGIDLPGPASLPVTVTDGIRAYLAELPGYDPSRPSPKDSQARQVHGYALYALRQHVA